MLKIGDTIKQATSIEGFDFVGENFKVTDIQANSISFTNSKMGNGIMSYDEFKKYFIKDNKREWETIHKDVINLLNLECIHNGKKVIVRTKNKEGKRVKGWASCSPEDEFNLDFGIELALERFNENMLNLIKE